MVFRDADGNITGYNWALIRELLQGSLDDLTPAQAYALSALFLNMGATAEMTLPNGTIVPARSAEENMEFFISCGYIELYPYSARMHATITHELSPVFQVVAHLAAATAKELMSATVCNPAYPPETMDFGGIDRATIERIAMRASILRNVCEYGGTVKHSFGVNNSSWQPVYISIGSDVACGEVYTLNIEGCPPIKGYPLLTSNQLEVRLDNEVSDFVERMIDRGTGVVTADGVADWVSSQTSEHLIAVGIASTLGVTVGAPATVAISAAVAGIGVLWDISEDTTRDASANSWLDGYKLIVAYKYLGFNVRYYVIDDSTVVIENTYVDPKTWAINYHGFLQNNPEFKGLTAEQLRRIILSGNSEDGGADWKAADGFTQEEHDAVYDAYVEYYINDDVGKYKRQIVEAARELYEDSSICDIEQLTLKEILECIEELNRGI